MGLLEQITMFLLLVGALMVIGSATGLLLLIGLFAKILKRDGIDRK